MISLRETARRYDIDPGYLSRRVRAGKAAQGHDLTPFAIIEDGKIQGFTFPNGHTFPGGSTLNNSTLNDESTPVERRENPYNGGGGSTNGASPTQHSTMSVDQKPGGLAGAQASIEAIDRKLGPREPSTLQRAGLAAAEKTGLALTDAIRENPASLPLLADPARHVTTLGMGILAGWFLNRRVASVSGTITGALLAATATDVFLRRDESILMQMIRGDKKEGDTKTPSMERSDVEVGEDPSEMIERIMSRVQPTQN